MKLAEIAIVADVRNTQLRERAQKSDKRPVTKHYLVSEQDVEVAFLSLDIIPGVDFLVAYEVFVAREHRGKSIGTRLMSEVENLAIGLGYKRVTLTPWPLEESLSEGRLIDWYVRRGYKEKEDCSGELEKILR